MAGRPFLPAPPAADMKRLFASRGWLQRAPAALVAAILAETRALRFVEGERLYSAGDSAGGMFGVVEGSIGVELASPVSDPVLGHIVRPGGWLGEGPALTGEARVAGFYALEPSVVLHLPLAAIARIAERDPDMMRLVGVQSELAARLGIRIVAELLITDSYRRVAATLVRATACDEIHDENAPQSIRLTQQQVGEMCGFSRHLAHRTLGRMQAEGLIRLTYNSITVLDAQALIASASRDSRAEVA